MTSVPVISSNPSVSPQLAAVGEFLSLVSQHREVAEHPRRQAWFASQEQAHFDASSEPYFPQSKHDRDRETRLRNKNYDFWPLFDTSHPPSSAYGPPRLDNLPMYHARFAPPRLSGTSQLEGEGGALIEQIEELVESALPSLHHDEEEVDWGDDATPQESSESADD